MGSFFKYLDDMDKNFNTKPKKENYVDEDDIVCEDEDVEEEQQEIVVDSSQLNFSSIKNRLINELNNLGLNKKKINEMLCNVFNEDNEYVVEEIQPRRRPAKQSSFKQRMTQQKKIQEVSISSRASDILDGVPGGEDTFVNKVIPNVPTQQPTQEYGQYMPPQQQYTPPQPVGPVTSINAEGIGSVAASAPQPMLQMPEGFENFKPEDSKNLTMGDAVNIIGKPNGEHSGQGVAMPSPQIMMPQGVQPLISQPVNPQQAQNILAAPGKEHFTNNYGGGRAPISKVTDHASQLL